GTDDAEDSDILLHEFGHAIQESIAPGAFGGSPSTQSRALGEAFGDYWSFSENYEATVPSGRDPFCIGDWDARCGNDDPSQVCGYPVGADCLRRVDSTKTMADFVISDVAGTEHTNGEIWSSALREIFMTVGKRTTDTLVLEATFGMPTSPTYALFAQRMLAVDRSLDAGANVPAICSAMTKRAILGSLDCEGMPRGDVTWFQSNTSKLTITDSRTIAGMSLDVVPSDAQVTLIGPDGTVGGTNAFIGKPAAGTWTLVSSQPVTWSLAITFTGDLPLQSRPNTTAAKFIAAVANAPGANGTRFITDVRLFNRSGSPAEVTAVFTPTSSDGTADFAAAKIDIAPNQIVAINDIVGTMLQSSGTGELELLGADHVLAMSRTYTRSAAGSFGQFVPTADPSEAVGISDDPVFVTGLENSDEYRSNIGFAEISGAPVEVHVRYFDKSGPVIGSEVYGLAPFSHSQVHVTPTGEGIRAEVTVTGGGRVLAYGSVVDNRSGDAIFIPAARVRQGYIPAIHAAGANGTLWRTDVWLSDISGGTVVSRDILGRDGFTYLNFANASKGGTLITSRTYTSGANGTYGQFVPPGVPSIGLATLVGIENDAAFRTNIGFISPSASTVRVIAYDASGNEVWRSDVAVQQIAQISLPVTLPLGRVDVQVLSGSGVVPYASVVDNQSGDPIYIVAQY
ncbi:MAG TPA: hypothetical protein VI391_04930, partial [Thermoanaerobaculia bacterium]